MPLICLHSCLQIFNLITKIHFFNFYDFHKEDKILKGRDKIHGDSRTKDAAFRFYEVAGEGEGGWGGDRTFNRRYLMQKMINDKRTI